MKKGPSPNPSPENFSLGIHFNAPCERFHRIFRWMLFTATVGRGLAPPGNCPDPAPGYHCLRRGAVPVPCQLNLCKNLFDASLM